MFETYITPRAARNKNLEWRYIINSSENVTLRQVSLVVVLQYLMSPSSWSDGAGGSLYQHRVMSRPGSRAPHKSRDPRVPVQTAVPGPEAGGRHSNWRGQGGFSENMKGGLF